jgi:hypothetical protein
MLWHNKEFGYLGSYTSQREAERLRYNLSAAGSHGNLGNVRAPIIPTQAKDSATTGSS